MIPRAPFIGLIVFLSGCMASTSSGIQEEGKAKRLPTSMPREIAIFPFGGNFELSAIAKEEFSQGLSDIGFEIVEREGLAAIIAELQIQQTGFVAPDKVAKLGGALGVRAIVMGTVEGESSPLWVDSHVNLRIVDVESGKVLWSCSAHDPRLFTASMSPKTSVIHSARNAIKLLRKDISLAIRKENGASASPRQ